MQIYEAIGMISNILNISDYQALTDCSKFVVKTGQTHCSIETAEKIAYYVLKFRSFPESYEDLIFQPSEQENKANFN